MPCRYRRLALLRHGFWFSVAGRDDARFDTESRQDRYNTAWWVQLISRRVSSASFLPQIIEASGV